MSSHGSSFELLEFIHKFSQVSMTCRWGITQVAETAWVLISLLHTWLTLKAPRAHPQHTCIWILSQQCGRTWYSFLGTQVEMEESLIFLEFTYSAERLMRSRIPYLDPVPSDQDMMHCNTAFGWKQIFQFTKLNQCSTFYCITSAMRKGFEKEKKTFQRK